MKHDCITSVTLHRLYDRFDRRGVIATFKTREVKNQEYISLRAGLVIRQMIALLGSGYEFNCTTADNHYSDPFGEMQECWVSETVSKRFCVSLTHKYWSPEQLDAFYSILFAMAKLHGWEVKDEREIVPNTVSSLTPGVSYAED